MAENIGYDDASTELVGEDWLECAGEVLLEDEDEDESIGDGEGDDGDETCIDK